jgi:hypothetical protein
MMRFDTQKFDLLIKKLEEIEFISEFVDYSRRKTKKLQMVQKIECPECIKKCAPVKWEEWMGDLKEHLISHYQMEYFFKYVSRTNQ